MAEEGQELWGDWIGLERVESKLKVYTCSRFDIECATI